MIGPAFATPVATSLTELVALRAAAAALARLRRRPSASAPMGASVSRKLGRGLDFAEVREYQPGDDIRMIDWNVTARSGRAHTKLFIEERERPVLLVVDQRSGMDFATRGVYKSALAVRLAAVLGWCAVSSNDRVGGLVFTDDGHREVRPRGGRRGLMPLLRALSEPRSQLASATVAPAASAIAPSQPATGSMARCLARLRQVAQAGSTVVMLSDFRGFDQASRSALGALLHHIDLLAVPIVDPLDYQLPPGGRYTLAGRDHSGPGRLSINTREARALAAHRARFEAQENDLAGFFACGRHPLIRVQTCETLVECATRVLQRQRAPALPDANGVS